MEYSSTTESLGSLNTAVSIKKKKTKNKRRFSDEQIKSMEVMFESETKLEPKRKLQLAKELGLQPRQVAIWFQNRRARWKSKHIEKEYSVLLANYNNLASQFESLRKEKQSLLIQLQKLKSETMGKSEDKKENDEGQVEENAGNMSSTDGESDYAYKKIDFEANNVGWGCLEGGMLSDDDSSIKAELLGLDDENELLKMVEPAGAADSSLTSAEDWESRLDSDDLINQPTDHSFQWWDFWS
ncbi:Transcription factor HEX [Handroanthus impetiginosus]|uniref:Homeobox-leucine zipper protein n=1 Tax=Handroanthus impetiginosus TaxID=429701 RepID=A0A2G9H743_9LAMI|nr:Transcription factor HEX [Handroanthus impetiginosus]